MRELGVCVCVGGVGGGVGGREVGGTCACALDSSSTLKYQSP